MDHLGTHGQSWNPGASHNQMAEDLMDDTDSMELWPCRYGMRLTSTPLPPHVSLAATGARDVANEADQHRSLKYSQLDPSYTFIGHRDM